MPTKPPPPNDPAQPDDPAQMAFALHRLERTIDGAAVTKAQEEERRKEEERAQRAREDAIACAALRNDLVHLLGTTLMADLEVATQLIIRSRRNDLKHSPVTAMALFTYRGQPLQLWSRWQNTIARRQWYLEATPRTLHLPLGVPEGGWDDDELREGLLLALAALRREADAPIAHE